MRRIKFSHWPRIFLNAGKSWMDDNAFKHSAAVSFYTLFSLAPITIIAVTVAGVFLGRDEARRQLSSQITQLVGPASAEMVQSVANASEFDRQSVLSTVIGVGLLLVGATTVFAQLQDSLNSIWNVRARPKSSGLMLMVIHRLVSFAMVLTIGFLLLVSLVLTTALTSALGRFSTGWVDSPLLASATDFVVGLVVITALFALLFKVLPDVKLRWRDVGLGALVTALLFTLGRYLIALYLGHSTVASVYGAAGSLVALLICVYYSCAILFYGVEFTRAYRLAGELDVEPKATAVRVREQIIEGRKGRLAKAPTTA